MRHLKTPRAQLFRLVGEAGLIIVSVYLAIVLEGVSGERAARASALESLRTVRTELETDLTEALAYAEQKRDRQTMFSTLSSWLRSDAVIPADSFGVTLEGVLTGNYTVFPRRASWTTMVSQGQLESLGDPELVSRLAELYEHWSDRVTYNGEAYDEAIWIVTRETIPSIWDRRAMRFMRSDRVARLELDAQLVHLEIWNESYGVLLALWAEEIEEVLANVDVRLDRSGGGA